MLGRTDAEDDYPAEVITRAQDWYAAGVPMIRKSY